MTSKHPNCMSSLNQINLVDFKLACSAEDNEEHDEVCDPDKGPANMPHKNRW